MTPRDQFAITRRVFLLLIQMNQVMAHLERQGISPSGVWWAYVATMGRYAQFTLDVVNHTNVVQPLLGKRCMFY